MIKVDFTEPQTPAWARWKAKCLRETATIRNAVASGGALPDVSNLYKAQKAAIIAAFRDKCVFCEKCLTSNQWGDVEHYRPKAAVQEVNWSSVQLSRCGRSGDHPGYWWLAYEPANLLLSCIKCNQVAKGREYGKGNRFPVAGFRAEVPGEEEREEPLLLNPCQDDPTGHIAITELGVCTAVGDSRKGHTTIEVLGLNERNLPFERADRFIFVETRINHLLSTRPENWLQTISEMQAPEKEFSAVARNAVRKVLNEVETALPLRTLR